MADLTVTRRCLAEEQAWQELIGRAAAVRDFESWSARCAWYSTVPRGPLTRRQQLSWFRGQKAAAGLWLSSEPIIPLDRQLEIALLAEERIEAGLVPTIEETTRDRVRRLHSLRMNDREICEELGLSDRQVRRVRDELGLTQNHFDRSPVEENDEREENAA